MKMKANEHRRTFEAFAGVSPEDKSGEMQAQKSALSTFRHDFTQIII
jgi:hypothetical protein